ncbi:hypothetical protein PQ459_04630 [Chryseobacterium sp. KACC 21268]|nr:hypothetical protein PQ459_04630 [Chryseobacterium sp. KACC 21268]
MEHFFKITGNLADIFMGIALIFAVLKFNLFNKKEKWYIYYAIFVFCIEMLLFFKIKWKNEILYPIYISGEFFLMTGIFIKKLNLKNYYLIFTGTLSLLILCLSQILPHFENDYSKAISNLVIVSFIAFSLIQEIKNYRDRSNFLFIDAMAFLYYTVSIFIFIFQHQLVTFDPNYFYIFWIINNTLLAIFYFTFLYTFFKLKK